MAVVFAHASEAMMETLIIGLLLAPVSGLTYVAYQHPLGYRRIFPWLWGGLTAVYFAIGAWTLGLMSAQNALIRFVVTEKQDEAIAVVEKLQIPPLWLLGAYGASSLYLFFLLYLPRVLDLPEKSHK